MTERDPLGLSADQREISDLYQSGLISGRSAGLLGDMTMACPSCRAYECLPGCLTRWATVGAQEDVLRYFLARPDA